MPITGQMKASDPLTFIFLIDESQLIQFIETQQPPEQKQKGLDVYGIREAQAWALLPVGPSACRPFCL